MASKSKLELQIESAQKKIQDEQRRLKQLQNKQAESDRKARNHRLCKRHGFLEGILPDTISLTDEQFEMFVKQHIGNSHGINALAKIRTQGLKQNNGENAPAGTKQHVNGNASAKSEQSVSNSNKLQSATA